MKRLLAVIMILCLLWQVGYADPYKAPHNDRQVVQTFTPLPLNDAEATTLKGAVQYGDVATRYNFKDVSGVAYNSAVRMAILGVSKGVGNRQFAPGSELNNIAVLTMLVRLYDDEAALEKGVYNQMDGASANSIQAALQDAYYARAQALGILMANESVSYTAPAKRQDIARWLANAGKLPAPNEQLEASTDWSSIRAENRDAVATLLAQRLLDKDDNGAVRPNDAMTRGQFTELLDRVVKQYADQLALTTHDAIVIAKQNNTTGDGTTTTFNLRKSDNTLLKIELNKPKLGEVTGLTVLRNAQLGDQSLLRIGDSVTVLEQQQSVKLVEVHNDSSVVQRLIDTLSQLDDLTVRQGTVLTNLTESTVLSGKRLTGQRVRLELDDDAMIELFSSVDQDGAIDEYPILNGKRTIKAKALYSGQPLTVYTKGSNVLYATVGKQPIDFVKGTLREIKRQEDTIHLTMLGFDNNVYSWTLNKDVNVYINRYRTTLDALKTGAVLSVRAIGDRVLRITAESYQPPAGYTGKAGRVKYATIKRPNGATIELVENDEVVNIGDNTQVLRGTQSIARDKLHAGDKVALYYDDAISRTPSKIIAEGRENLIGDLVRAKLINYNQYTDQIKLTGCHTLENSKWQKAEAYSVTYKLAKQVAVYDGNQSVGSALNKDYINREAYLVVVDNFGRPEVTKMVFKRGNERHYDDVIADYSTIIDKMRLKNNVDVTLDDGTIYIKDDRVVDRINLRDNAGVYVLANQLAGADVARIVSMVDGYDNVFSRFYIGAVEAVNPYDMTIKNYVQANGKRLSNVNQTAKKLYTNDQTIIRNLTSDTVVPVDDFFNKDYSRFENETKGKKIKYNRYYGVFVTDGQDNVISMAIRFQELLKNDKMEATAKSEAEIVDKMQDVFDGATFSKGKIVGKDNAWQRVELKDAYNYVNYYGEWQTNGANQFVDLASAVIVKGNQNITFNQLKTGDVVYVVRSEQKGFVAFVEE